MANYVYVTNEANHNRTTLHRNIILWNFRLGNIGIQHVQWLIHTEHLKAQENPKAVPKCERKKCAACEFGKVHRLSNKVNTIKNSPMK